MCLTCQFSLQTVFFFSSCSSDGMCVAFFTTKEKEKGGKKEKVFPEWQWQHLSMTVQLPCWEVDLWSLLLSSACGRIVKSCQPPLYLCLVVYCAPMSSNWCVLALYSVTCTDFSFIQSLGGALLLWHIKYSEARLSSRRFHTGVVTFRWGQQIKL